MLTRKQGYAHVHQWNFEWFRRCYVRVQLGRRCATPIHMWIVYWFIAFKCWTHLARLLCRHSSSPEEFTPACTLLLLVWPTIPTMGWLWEVSSCRKAHVRIMPNRHMHSLLRLPPSTSNCRTFFILFLFIIYFGCLFSQISVSRY